MTEARCIHQGKAIYLDKALQSTQLLRLVRESSRLLALNLLVKDIETSNIAPSQNVEAESLIAKLISARIKLSRL